MPRRVLPAIVLGGLVAGAFDITYAIVFSYLRRGVAPSRVLQSVASGLLGPAAYDGGASTAALGLGLHFFIALVAAAIYVLASRYLPVLIRRPVLAGAVYGLGIYVFMNCVVIPLSRIGPKPFPPSSVLVSGLLVHMFLIGVTIAFAARRAWGSTEP
ncbi:MAG TPA: hypothetical protein VLX28_12535 [Thermoanaerobaculia bacterium]|nr:hypothetical protein [Thermoanaerobaculia bacterium]